MLKNICRVCGRYAAYKRSVNIFENKNTLWNIQALTGLMLKNVYCLPDLICICCQTELREAIRFRDRVIVAQNELMDGLTEEEIKEIPMEYREAVTQFAIKSSQKKDSTSNSEAESEGCSEAKIKNVPEAENELIIKTQAEEEVTYVEEDAKQEEDLIEYDIVIYDENRAEAVAEAEDVQTYDIVEDLVNEEQLEIVEEVTDDIETIDFILSDKDSDAECVVLDRVLNDEIAVAQHSIKKKPGRKRIGSLIFTCEDCGNHISGRMAFELHCRRHRGDKQFICTVCEDRFCTSSELKRHTRRHTGERPFACQHCGRCFTDYSTRVKHERTHTNERPYVCNSCGKAFYTAYILKNHMLIHSGERAFRCEQCNKSFVRQTHLVTHCRSSAHKRNVERKTPSTKIKG